MQPGSEVLAPWLCHPICSWPPISARTQDITTSGHQIIGSGSGCLSGSFPEPSSFPLSPCSSYPLPVSHSALSCSFPRSVVSMETACVPIPWTLLSWASMCLSHSDRNLCSKDSTPMCCAALGRQLRVTPTLPSSGRHLEGLGTDLEPSYLGVD